MKFIHEFYRDEYGRKSKPERYILLNQQGETVSTPIVLKTANSIKALSDMLDRAAPLQFPKAVSVYDTKLNKTIEVIFLEKSTWRRTGFESVLPTQYKDMFSNKPKTTSESNLNEIGGIRFNFIMFDKQGRQIPRSVAYDLNKLDMSRAHNNFMKNIVPRAFELNTIPNLHSVKIMYNDLHIGTAIPKDSNFEKGPDYDKLPISEASFNQGKLSKSFQASLNRKPLKSKYIALDSKGNALSTPMALKTSASIYSMFKYMNSSPYSLSNINWKNGGAFFDLKTNSVVAVIVKSKSNGWDIFYEKTPELAKLFSVKPKPKALQNVTEAMSESSKSVTELIESVVRQTIIEAYEPVMFDPMLHKTLDSGAMDYEYDVSNPNTINVFAPFKEEPNVMVHMKISKKYFDDLLDDGYIESQEDLDAIELESDVLRGAIVTLMRRPELLKKYNVMTENVILELNLSSAGVKEFLMFVKRYPKYLHELGFASFKILLDTIKSGDVNVVYELMQELMPALKKETNPRIKQDAMALMH